MDADLETRRNPFGMDESCRNCPALCDVRERVVHGYGDVGADFVFVGESPSAGAERTGVPFTGDAGGERFQGVLDRVGLTRSSPTSDAPELENAYLTYLTRCRHPERAARDEEVDACEPFLNADVRMINPEVIVPVGARALAAVAEEYTTTPAEDLDVVERHATAVRGRGFELFPMVHPASMTDAQAESFVSAFRDLLETDYRQTKGRRGR